MARNTKQKQGEATPSNGIETTSIKEDTASDQPKPKNASQDEEVRKESSKIAQKALAAQEKAAELARAAIAAGDPQERQKLLNQALQKEIEAESFGKTAKWLSSGSFQGFLAGSGIGSVPGVTLGTLTGTLVGGVTTLITGGLGGAVGAGVGAAHGPFFKMGDVVGGALNKWLPTIPGWQATKEQKRDLEKMLGQIDETDQPSADELKQMTATVTSSKQEPTKAGAGENGQQSVAQNKDKEVKPTKDSATSKRTAGSVNGTRSTSAKSASSARPAKLSDPSHSTQSTVSSKTPSQAQTRPKQRPKKLEVRSSASAKT